MKFRQNNKISRLRSWTRRSTYIK